MTVAEKRLYKGIIQGEVTTVFIIGRGFLYFTVKIKENLSGIPKEIPVYAKGDALIRKGDQINIYGEIYQGDWKIWEKDIVRMFPEHLYNETLKCGFKKGPRKSLFKGRVHGKITSVVLSQGTLGGGFMYFSMKLNENIEGVPKEIFVNADGMTMLRDGDAVMVEGEIFLQNLKFWQDYSIEMKAKHVYNETLNFGF